MKEHSILTKAYKLGIPVPRVEKLSNDTNTLNMEYINGVKLKDWFNESHTELEITKQLLKMGFLVFRLH